MSLFKIIYTRFFISICLCCFYLIFSTPTVAASYSAKNLQQQAQAFIAKQIAPEQQAHTQVSALPLDSRINARQCDTDLAISTTASPPFNRQVVVQLKCLSQQTWHQFVHVRINTLVPVVMTTKTLNKGEIISADDVVVKMQASQFARNRHLQSPHAIIGSRLKRTMRQGAPLTMNMLCMVCKGDTITILATLNGLSIKTTGEALQNGVKGQVVRVKNSKSGRIISAKVSQVETVSVTL